MLAASGFQCAHIELIRHCPQCPRLAASPSFLQRPPKMHGVWRRQPQGVARARLPPLLLLLMVLVLEGLSAPLSACALQDGARRQHVRGGSVSDGGGAGGDGTITFFVTSDTHIGASIEGVDVVEVWRAAAPAAVSTRPEISPAE
eukprot:354567-Chlamydomonas_euryale.AAC.3